MKTYECKIKDNQAFDFIRAINSYYGHCIRKLYVKLYIKPVKDRNQLKREFCKEYECSSTHFNSMKNHVETIHSSQKELLQEHYKTTLNRIKHTKENISKRIKLISKHNESISNIIEYDKQLERHKNRLQLKVKSKKPRKPNRIIDKTSIKDQRRMISDLRFIVHQKKRRVAILEEKSHKQAKTIKIGKYSICFGTKRLLQKQNYLKENAYENHKQWKEDWRFRRSNQSFWLGDSGETCRNRNVKFNLEDKTIRFSVPQKLRKEFGSFVIVNNIEFDQRAKKDIFDALAPSDENRPSPLSYRLLEREKTVHDKGGTPRKVKSIYLQVSVTPVFQESETRRNLGAIGVDLNLDHLAIGEVDRHGNPVQAFNLFFSIEGKSTHQINAIFGDCISKVVRYAKLKNKPLVIEKLDFRSKKSALRETHGPKMARLLSSFAYAKFKYFMESRSSRERVELIKVNPAYSSVLGAFNYFGLRHLYSSHQMAAFVLARRGLRFKDSLKSTYNERNYTALLRTVSIAVQKAPPTFEAWIKSGGKRHRWSLLRRYYRSYSHFVKHLGKKPFSTTVKKIQETRRNIAIDPLQHLCSL